MLNSSVPTLAAMLVHDVSCWSRSTSVPAAVSACTTGRRTGRDQTPLSQSAPTSASSGSAASSLAIAVMPYGAAVKSFETWIVQAYRCYLLYVT